MPDMTNPPVSSGTLDADQDAQARATTLDTTPHQEEAPPTPLVSEPSVCSRPPLADASYTPPKCDQFSRSVSHAILIGMENENETLASLADTLEIPIEQVLSALVTTGERISELLSTYPATVPPLAENP